MRHCSGQFIGWLAVVILMVFFSFSTHSFSQSYLVHQYTELDGLPSTTVHDIAQDRWGRMWFATRGGIAVYDGVSWRNYTVPDGLPVLAFAKIQVDQKGRIWAMSSTGLGGLVVVFHDGREGSRWRRIEAHYQSQFDIDAAQLVEITSFQLGEPQENVDRPVIAVGTADQGIFLLQEKWKRLTETNGLLSNSVNGIDFLDGRFYVATGKGLSIIHVNHSSKPIIDNRLNHLLDLPAREIKSIAIQHKNKFPDSRLKHPRIWFYGKGWLGYVNENGFKMTLYPVGIPLSLKKEMGVIQLQPDYLCGLYVSDKVLTTYFNYNTRAWEPINVSSGIITDGANSIFIDYEKNIWIGSNRGVSKIVSRRFSNFQKINGLLEDEVTAVLEYEAGKFVLGHNHGITVYDGKTFQKASLAKRDEAKPTLYRVLDMQLDSKGNVWLAMAWAGLAKITPQSPQQVTWYGKAEGLPDNIICLWIDKSKDHIWVGTEKGIFSCAAPAQGFTLTNVKPLSRLSARRIYGSAGKLRYIATHKNGIYVYDDGSNQWKKYQVPGNPEANDAYSLIKDSRDRLLIGTLDGVYILENETLKKFKMNDFQLDRPVYFILEDNKNRLWFGTDNGVVRWNGKEARKYTTANGLIGHETNRAAGIVDSKGRVWIGTIRGVSIYDEAFDFDESYHPSPKIQLLYVETPVKKTRLSAPVQLAHKENTVVFHFRGISFLDEAAIRFSHKLEGFDNEWSEEKYHYNQTIRYTNLPSGAYRFHLKAKNALGAWSDIVTSPKITILKPFYQKWWFYLMVFLVVGGLFYGIFQFISEKRQAVLLEKQVEERTNQLHALESRYRSLFEESKDMVFISTPEGTVLDVNPAGLELFGIRSKEEVLGQTLVPEFYNNLEDRPPFREVIEKNGYVKDYELVLRRADGKVITVLITATVVRDEEGNITAYRGIGRDITEQKKLEQQLVHAQKMEAIGTLAGGIAHDFNNILGVIVGYTELLRDGLPEGSQMHKNADQIMVAAKRGADLVKQILTFSRRDEQEQKPLNLSSIVKESLKLLRSSLPATIEIRQDIRNTSGTILANATKIHQVMMNLAANAAYAMQESGGILGVRLEEIYLDMEDVNKYDNMKAGPFLRLSISDTGQGIPKEVREHIFEPFFTTKEVGEGTGMGLSVIHGIVKSHQGDISAYSEPGEGTTFHVLLPCIEEEAEPKKQVTENIPGGSERILFVDDETDLAAACTQMLQGMGYEVKGESKPLEALETFRKESHRFDLVITDLTMPTMTGLQLAGQLKRIRSDIPVILCSGFFSGRTMEQLEAAGVDDFVMKPIVKSKLARVIRKVLDKGNHN